MNTSATTVPTGPAPNAVAATATAAVPEEKGPGFFEMLGSLFRPAKQTGGKGRKARKTRKGRKAARKVAHRAARKAASRRTRK